MKITRSSDKLILKAFSADDNKVVDDGSNKTNRTIVNLSKNKKSRNLTRVPNIEAIEEYKFLTPNAKKAFNYLWLAFIKAPILWLFDLKNCIWIEINALSYIINRLLSSLNFDSNASPNDSNSNKSDFGQ